MSTPLQCSTTAIVLRSGRSISALDGLNLNFANVQGNRGARTKDQINEAANAGIYAENQLDATENGHHRGGGSGGACAPAEFGTAFKSTPTP